MDRKSAHSQIAEGFTKVEGELHKYPEDENFSRSSGYLF